MLDKIPRMIKNFAHKAKAFNGRCMQAVTNGGHVLEHCFDMQIQLVRFFINCITYIHDASNASTNRRLPLAPGSIIALPLENLNLG
ncbi:hypothetical protein QBC44DRAFT_313836 [Cladorrhinum sp. PSN332]|nr:hypothetical protein QBC44DRAFT_313836 [Cladorrhinum sp. PSN332]